MNSVTIGNENISLGFDLGKGISLTSIYSKVNGFEFLSAPSPLFMFSADEGWEYSSDTSNIFGIPGVIVDNFEVSEDNDTLTIECTANNNVPVAFTLEVKAAARDISVIISTVIRNTGSQQLDIKYLNPCVNNLVVPGYNRDSERMLGMIPREIGEVVTLNKGMTIGMFHPGKKTTFTSGMNVMEVACMYDRDGDGGVFFADLDGDLGMDVSPVQMGMKEGEAWGLWEVCGLQPGSSIAAPRIAVGVSHSRSYETAVDYYVNARKQHWKYPKKPTWLKEAGGIWCPGAAGSGGAYMVWGYCDLSLLISSFDHLPEIYEQAAAMGTNFFYLSDYWEGNVPGLPAHYWNKGDYIPRSDLGGEEALVRGINGIHDKGGKVIMYIEAFIIYKNSLIGQTRGEHWAARNENGVLLSDYPDNYTMIACFEPWQDYVSEIAKRLVVRYGADGVFLDSFGYQFNKRVKNLEENKLCTRKEWNKGVYRLVDKVRAAITSVKADAVVLCECGGAEMGKHMDGGSSSDFAWTQGQNDGRIIASPVRHGNPEINFFTNGTTMNHLIQVYAAGHSLALNHKWNPYSGFIKKLLDLRRTYRDAMIYGVQTQPSTGSMKVAAYYYKGTINDLITIANVDIIEHPVRLLLPLVQGVCVWVDALTDETFNLENNELSISIGGSESNNFGLRVLVRKCHA